MSSQQAILPLKPTSLTTVSFCFAPKRSLGMPKARCEAASSNPFRVRHRYRKRSLALLGGAFRSPLQENSGPEFFAAPRDSISAFVTCTRTSYDVRGNWPGVGNCLTSGELSPKLACLHHLTQSRDQRARELRMLLETNVEQEDHRSGLFSPGQVYQGAASDVADARRLLLAYCRSKPQTRDG